MAILDMFIGVPQSKYAGLAILVALLSVSVAMLMGKDSLSMGQKFVAILMMFLVALPGLLLSLFQLTCLVTGSGKGTGNKTWWCGAYAWIGTILAFLYALVVVAIAVIAISRGTDVHSELALMNVEMFAEAKKAADKAAKEHFQDEAAAPATAEKKPEEAAVAADAAAAAEPGTVMEVPPVDPSAEVVLPEDAPVEPSSPETFTSCGAPIGKMY